MGLFSFFNRNNGSDTNAFRINGSTTEKEIPEDIFIERDKPQEHTLEAGNGERSPDYGINVLFRFLEQNHEAKGYDDALVNPDSTHLDQNIAALRNELERTIRRVKTFYEDFIREINFHIDSRGRAGMIDTVGELTVKKETADNHIKQVIQIEEQAKKEEGVGQGIIISYKRGFRNGLAAISHHSIMRKNF